MCQHSRYIYNPYSRRKVLVKCGKCEACLQEKACARSNRIRNNVSDGTIALFITLTYTNDYVPYIRKSDLLKPDLDVPVYRNCNCRYVFSRSHGYSLKKISGISLIDKVYIPTENRLDSSVFDLHSLVGLPSDCVGVCYYKDFQDFIKRLRITLKRNYNYEKSFSYFSCSELGSHTKRPHFHSLLFIRKDDEAIFRDAIVTCWSYADKYRTKNYVEIARDAASYVSSYVNSHVGLDSPLSVSEFTPQHSYSKHFGVVLDCFSLSSILEKIDRGDLHYYRQQRFDGTTSVVALPIPTYVINRYFPKFKGFGRLSTDALERILLDPSSVGFELQHGKQTVYYKEHKLTLYHEAIQDSPLYSFSSKETYQIFVRLFNAYKYFNSVCGLGRYDFMHYYLRAWKLHTFSCFKDSYNIIDTIDDFRDFYENAFELVAGYVDAPTLPDLDFVLNPDSRRDIAEKHNHMVDLFHKLDKEKKVVNLSMSYFGHNV